MTNEQDLFEQYSDDFNRLYKKRKIILSFGDFTRLIAENPKPFMRDASHYLTDVFSYYGKEKVQTLDIMNTDKFLLFELFQEKEKKIISCEKVQNEIYHSLSNFKRKGFVDKLIFLFGASGSSKSLTIEKIARGMENYSQKREGAVYKFNWIFPTILDSEQNKNKLPSKIGFNSENITSERKTFAFLPEDQILSKIQSEFKENPLFLIPMPYREDFLRKMIAKNDNIKEENVVIPNHLLSNGLSKKNQEILDNLLTIYNGNLQKVFRHIQVERFFYSSQYRVGISSVDPQVPINAYEKQITINGNYHKLPAYLHDINFHESSGELVDANRGLIEYSDLLSKPLAQVKQLLNTIERRYIKLSSCIAQLDLVYIATTDDKHMEAFKQSPEFNSFRGHFEPIMVPYLLKPSDEKKIYEEEILSLKKEMKVCPHTLDLLSLWAVMNRLKPSESSYFEEQHHELIKKLGPRDKVRLYEGESQLDSFTREEEKELFKLRSKIWHSSKEGPFYEGRFGPSPRDVVQLLHKTANRSKNKTITPMDLFNELEDFSKEVSSYEFLKFEAKGDFHNQKSFLNILKKEYAKIFEDEIAQAMSITNKNEYTLYLKKYIQNVVAHLKGEKVFNKENKTFEEPSRSLMNHLEEILKIQTNIKDHRSDLLNKIAAYKIENPGKEINVSELFKQELKKIKNHFFLEQRKIIEANYTSILKLMNPDKNLKLQEREKKDIDLTFRNMEEDYGYSKESIYSSIRFITNNKEKSPKLII